MTTRITSEQAKVLAAVAASTWPLRQSGQAITPSHTAFHASSHSRIGSICSG